MALDPGWIALIGTLFGGAGLKMVDHYVGKNQAKADYGTQIRDELRLEINAQREEIKVLEDAVSKWREEYYNLRDKYTELQTELTITLQKLKEALAALDKLTPPAV